MSSNVSRNSGMSLEQTNSRPLAEYCAKIADGSGASFHNLDDVTELREQMHRLQNTATDDFMVLFNDDEAYSAFNLCARDYATMLSDHAGVKATRWINIWFPSQHEDLLENIGKRYDFSPRLLALILSRAIPHAAASSLSNHAVPSLRSDRSSWFTKHKSNSVDTERSHGQTASKELSLVQSVTSEAQNNVYRLANEIWHYTTMDFGRNYICVGYNSLYGVAPLQDDLSESTRTLPSCTRIWTWLIICEDDTVITINEDIFPQAQRRYTAAQLRTLAETRRNLVNVFRSLSLVDSDPLECQNPMTLLPIRARLGTTESETVHHESNAPGLLFYYLFENWQNSYTLITRKESHYGIELERLRKEMFIRPRLAHIDRLHRIGQELGILKRHYAGYDRIIDRLLEPRPPTLASLQNSQVADLSSDCESVSTIRPLLAAKESSLGVSLSNATRMRFKRLKDLIDLYAMSEVDEYLTQKESLVSLNFNLLTLKESLDVEKLTRITLLLTKATFLFLPVSYMTSYFGIALADTSYSVTQYWTAFAVIFILSSTALFVFGLVSGSVETTSILKLVRKSSAYRPKLHTTKQASEEFEA